VSIGEATGQANVTGGPAHAVHHRAKEKPRRRRGSRFSYRSASAVLLTLLAALTRTILLLLLTWLLAGLTALLLLAGLLTGLIALLLLTWVLLGILVLVHSASFQH